MVPNIEKIVKKGELLLKEGSRSNSMFLLLTGSVRLFKRKEQGEVEIAIIQAGEVIGDMSFFDESPRSASAEALQDCTLIEIPRKKYEELMPNLPNWMKIQIKTLVNRLRSATNRIRQFEMNSTVTYNVDGKLERKFEFLSNTDILRACAALNLACQNKGKKQEDNVIKVQAGWLEFYGHQILNVHTVKISSFTDVLEEHKVLDVEKDKARGRVTLYVKELLLLNDFMVWLNGENRKMPEDRIQITELGMQIFRYIHRFGDLKRFDEKQEEVELDMAEVWDRAVEETELEQPFSWSAYYDLVKLGISTPVIEANLNEKNVSFQLKKFNDLFPFVNLHHGFLDLNESKRREREEQLNHME